MPERDDPYADENSGWEIVDGTPDYGKVVWQEWGPYAYANAQIKLQEFASTRRSGSGRGFNMRAAVRGEHYRVDKGRLVPTVPDDTSVKQDGYDMGRALATLIGVSATFDFQSLTTLGIMFAELKGYRDMRTGNQFVGGMVAGFQDAADGGNGTGNAPVSKRLPEPDKGA